MGAAVAAVLALAVLWRVPAFRNPSEEKGNTVALEMQQAEDFMTEIAMLVDNPLPAVYQDISAESTIDEDEDLTEFVVPSVENEPLTQNGRKRGMSLC